MKIKRVLSGRLSVLPCCIQREADGITVLPLCGFCGKTKPSTCTIPVDERGATTKTEYVPTSLPFWQAQVEESDAYNLDQKVT
jgi:hypothetical protein